MKKPKPSVNVRIYKVSHKRIKVHAAKDGISIIEAIDRFSKKKV